MSAPAAGPAIVLMGILNVTPDSFSDGGRWATPEAAVARGRTLAAHGASIIDVGGESSRPGAGRIDPDEERARVIPAIAGLAAAGLPVTLSVDTRRAAIARAAIDAGAGLVNDVSGGLDDSAMLPLIAETGVDYICQRSQVVPAGTADPVMALRDELLARRDACLACGIAPERLILDPGLGFGTSAEQDWAALARLEAFTSLGHRVVIGPSRKRFITWALQGCDHTAGETLPAAGQERLDAATAAVCAWAARRGVWAVRVHEPAITRAWLR